MNDCELIVTFEQKSFCSRNGNYFNLVSFNQSLQISIPFRYNEYDWCPLDIAIMLNNIPMIQLLVQYGAIESSKSKSKRMNEFKSRLFCSSI